MVIYVCVISFGKVKLLLRGLHLLAPGGKLMYSTRSLNPLEVTVIGFVRG